MDLRIDTHNKAACFPQWCFDRSNSASKWDGFSQRPVADFGSRNPWKAGIDYAMITSSDAVRRLGARAHVFSPADLTNCPSESPLSPFPLRTSGFAPSAESAPHRPQTS
ncbi:hypothetical protein RvY_16433-2 [Ramazzottius varieornatus]|nr:hypothetical protein RvY_16433-2 [Ramazzottius varieornatus]